MDKRETVVALVKIYVVRLVGDIIRDTEICLVLEDEGRGDSGSGSGRSSFPFCEVLLPLEVINDFLALSEHGGMDEGVDKFG